MRSSMEKYAIVRNFVFPDCVVRLLVWLTVPLHISPFQEGEFPGFVPLIKEYLNDIDDVDIDTSCTILQYLNFISKRASGNAVV